MSYQQDKFTEIADAIRDKLKTEEKIKPNDFASKINEVYEKGKAEGGDGNTEQIFDELASAIQSGGARTDFAQTFKNSTINDERIREIFARWNSTIKTSSYMFQDAKNLQEGLYTDTLDFSQSSSLLSAFQGTNIVKVKKIDARKTVLGWNGMANTFYDCKNLESIDEFYPSINTKFSGTFSGCPKLKKVIFMSEIAVDGLTFEYSPLLNRNSIEKIFENLSTSTSGLTVTISEKAVKREFETSEGANDGDTSADWKNVRDSRMNWKIVLNDREASK